MSETTLLAEFDNPPVSEVAISIDFNPVAGWSGLVAGAYWAEIKDRYPGTEVHPALPSQIETFDALPGANSAVNFVFMPVEQTRYWFKSDPAIHLIQLQPDRFIVNWRKVTGDEVYPRYETNILPKFLSELAIFRAFAAKSGLGALAVRQCEITYVNDIPKGEAWSDLSEAFSLISLLQSGGSREFLPSPETFLMAGSYRMPEDRGRMHFAIQHLFRQPSMQEVLQLRLAARGRPLSSSDDDLVGFINAGREWIVSGFTDMTTPKAHALWGRTR